METYVSVRQNATVRQRLDLCKTEESWEGSTKDTGLQLGVSEWTEKGGCGGSRSEEW
jgi:hypothetical protein